MSNIYLVKKNPELPVGKDNWIVMNFSEYEKYINTEAGKSCADRMERIVSADYNDYNIYIECDSEYAKELKLERNRQSYISKMRADLGIEVLSLQYYQDNEADGTAEDIFDESQDVEQDAIKQYDISRLHYALSMLTAEEMDLINSMYLASECTTERQYAEKAGMLNTTVHYMKKRVLGKLKALMAG